MALTDKQKKFIFDFTKYRTSKNLFILAGGAGSGKSFVCLLLLHKLCLEYAPLRVGVFRKSTVNLKNNTIPSFNRVLFETETQKSVVLSDFKATYKNGSEILFLWADSEKDPDCNNIKGLELSCALFEEVNQVEKHVFHTVRSRVGRWNTGIRALRDPLSEACAKNDEFEIASASPRNDGGASSRNDGGVLPLIKGTSPVIARDFNFKNGKKAHYEKESADFPPFVLANCNPNNTWVKHDFYDPYVEGKLNDNEYFQESLPFDNKNLAKDYIKMLETLPQEQKRRYLYNDWYYAQDSNNLVSQEYYNAALVEAKPEGLFGDIILAIDPADEGADLTVFAYMQGGCVFRFESFQKQNEVKSAHIALLRAKEFGIKPYNIIVDSVGIGAGCLNTLLLEGFLATKFVGGESPRSELPFYHFKNKRAEAAWLLRESLHNGEIKIIKNQRLHNEILATNYSIDGDKTLVLQAKKEIKKTLGHSPDYFDALMMANYRHRELNSRPITALNACPKRLSGLVKGY